jgi:hypothetical protein
MISWRLTSSFVQWRVAVAAEEVLEVEHWVLVALSVAAPAVALAAPALAAWIRPCSAAAGAAAAHSRTWLPSWHPRPPLLQSRQTIDS